jgi:hypothetical protein
MLLALEAPLAAEMMPADLPVHLKEKSYDGRTYVIAVNSDEEFPVAPTFTLPDGTYEKVDVLFENRSMALKGDSFRSLFDSTEVHVYRIE